MTMIDKISFRFRMADEQFAKELYADWDRFCRRCAIEVIDEFFGRYDNRDTYININRLDIDLGGIPDKGFRKEFPLRLREALERTALPRLRALGSRNGSLHKNREMRRMEAFAQEKRFENLLHCLEYGFCLPEWDIIGFDPYEELPHIADRKMLERLSVAITENPNAAERFFARAHNGLPADMLSVMLSSSLPGHAAKQRYIAAALEHMPRAVLRFIHETKESGSMENLALLLDNSSIRRIMTAETENHAEIGVPEYWYGLYEWLSEYYPFNGVPMIGDKRHFRLHLNRSLLSFIRRRSYPSYLSKAELTMQFLTEVFGAEHGIAILNIIYRNQRLNPDGTPASADSRVREIYYMLLRLSMIESERQPDGHTEDSAVRRAEIMHKDRLLTVAESLGGRHSEVLAKTIRMVEARIVGMNLFTGGSAELNRSFAKALALMIADGRNPADMSDEETIRTFISFWRSAVTGRKEMPAHDREKWERLEREVTYAVTDLKTPTANRTEKLIAGRPAERRSYESASDAIRRYIAAAERIPVRADRQRIIQCASAESDEQSDDYPNEKADARKSSREALPKEIEAALHIEPAERSPAATVLPDYIEVPNAGLCLLALWLPRLFDMLGLLSENAGAHRDLKDTEARIRAIFIIQRLATDERKAYDERNLAFNRILAGCPFHVPLPETLELTEGEIRAAESMLAGAKANWGKLQNTSIKGFRSSFIERPGRLERREDKWVLYVEVQAYDILLDSLPWPYRRIRLPWLKKRIDVVWRDKEEYDFEKA